MGTNGAGDADHPRRCFVVSAFGDSADDQRRYKQVLRHLVQKVLKARYVVIRADEIDDEGLITNQIIEHLLNDDLVVADLTDMNPNVFYEVAVRHAARKPIVHIVTKGQEIPFDVANMRAVQYALDDPDALEAAQDELERKVRAIEENDWVAAPNPITAALDVWLLKESEQPDVRKAGDLLSAVGELRDEVRSLARRVEHTDQPLRDIYISTGDFLIRKVKEHDPITEDDLAMQVPFSRKQVRKTVQELLAQSELFLVEGKLSLVPF